MVELVSLASMADLETPVPRGWMELSAPRESLDPLVPSSTQRYIWQKRNCLLLHIKLYSS